MIPRDNTILNPWAQRCGSCVFFVNPECHRYAPRERGQSDHNRGEARWPKVSATSDWCGEYVLDQRVEDSYRNPEHPK